MSNLIDKNAAIRSALQASKNGLDALIAQLDGNGVALDKALDLIFGMSGRLIVSGVGKSGLIGRKLAATFASTGTPSYFVHALEASHGDLGMIQPGDVVLLLSRSGDSRELGDIIAYAQRFAIPIVAMTNGGRRLAQNADIVLALPEVREACPHNLAPTTSSQMQLALGDALAVTLLQMRGFTEHSFRYFHPGGRLGAALTPVSEIMFSGDALPLVGADASVFDVVSEISGKGHGIAGVTDAAGALAGVVTDGDIRRYLEANSKGSMRQAMWETGATDIMTRGMISLGEDQLCGRVLNILQSRRISAAFIVKDGLPAGLITTLRLLESGVA